MTRLRVFFAIVLFFVALPLWRMGDYIAIIMPSEMLFAMFIQFMTLAFLWIPIKLIKREIPIWTIASCLLFALTAYLTGPLSRNSTLAPDQSHCGSLTYTGFFYPLHSILSEAYQDDLEAKNQMCWLRKMITKVPEKIDNSYLGLSQNILARPEIKFKSSLPLLAFYQGYVFSKIDNSPIGLMQNGQNFVASLGDWKTMYAYEISDKNFAWYEWPYSSIVKFEYGLIEGNWENIKFEVNTL